MRKWNVLSDKKAVQQEEIVEQLLENRGIKTQEDREEFLHPLLSSVSIKSVGIDQKNVKKALRRIQDAIANNEKIVIFGDYDVDGICGTAILWETLYKKYKNVTPYIPDRFGEGYGLSVAGMDNLLQKHTNIKLIVTVDNGIVAYDAVEYAKTKGIDVIVTDHHVPGEKKLSCFTLVHTTKLCGTAVAYLFSRAFQGKEEIADDEYLDLVTLATIADLVPLVSANRTLVKNGLPVLNKTTRPGLLALFQIAGIQKGKIGVYEVGHVICPRLNAMGRLFSAMDSLRLVCTKNPIKASNLAENLHATNRERQVLTEETTTHAGSQLLVHSSQRIVFVAHETYNEGIIGLVASRLVELHHRPAFVISIGETHSKGSARSIKGVNIIEMIRSVSSHVVQAGGHPMAAGFTLETTKIGDLKAALEALGEELINEEMLQKTITIDMPLDFSSISFDLYKSLEKLSPFGLGNPEPTFVTRKAVIQEMKPVGKTAKHLKLKLKANSSELTAQTFNAIAFGIGERAKDFKIGDAVDVIYSIAEDTWLARYASASVAGGMGNNKLQLKVKDILIPG